jgi:hypothetical protein
MPEDFEIAESDEDFGHGSDYLELTETQASILQQTGIMLWIVVRNTTHAPESVMEVYSRCEFCGPVTKRHETYLGSWQRNRTQFGRFLTEFENYEKGSSFNDSDLNIGYFNHPPHFSCSPSPQTNSSSDSADAEKNCAGVEWEIIFQFGRSLHIDFSLFNLGADHNHRGRAITNISRMISALHDGTIDFAVGGISVTSERMALIDFSKVFATEPIGKI